MLSRPSVPPGLAATANPKWNRPLLTLGFPHRPLRSFPARPPPLPGLVTVAPGTPSRPHTRACSLTPPARDTSRSYSPFSGRTDAITAAFPLPRWFLRPVKPFHSPIGERSRFCGALLPDSEVIFSSSAPVWILRLHPLAGLSHRYGEQSMLAGFPALRSSAASPWKLPSTRLVAGRFRNPAPLG